MKINSISSTNYQSNKHIKNTQFHARIPMNIEHTTQNTIQENKLIEKAL